MRGLSAEIMIGRSARLGPEYLHRAVKKSPSIEQPPSRMLARTIARYSRIAATGLLRARPHIASTVTLWLTPRPRMNRPPDSSSSVAAICTIAVGWRV